MQCGFFIKPVWGSCRWCWFLGKIHRERGREKEKQRERDKLHLEGLNSTLPGTPQAQEEIFGFDDIRDFRRKWPFRIPSHEVVSSKAWAAYTVFKEQCEEVTNSYLTAKVNSQQSQDQRWALVGSAITNWVNGQHMNTWSSSWLPRGHAQGM